MRIEHGWYLRYGYLYSQGEKKFYIIRGYKLGPFYLFVTRISLGLEQVEPMLKVMENTDA